MCHITWTNPTMDNTRRCWMSGLMYTTGAWTELIIFRPMATLSYMVDLLKRKYYWNSMTRLRNNPMEVSLLINHKIIIQYVGNYTLYWTLNRDGCHMWGMKCSLFPEHLISLPLRSSWFHSFIINFICNGHGGGRRCTAVACWASDHWVASSNPFRGKFCH